MIHFKLFDISEINPFGLEQKQPTMHWFGLTDGIIWLEFDEIKLFEYSNEIIKFWNKSNPYNDYYIARFIEDLTSLFSKINESIPLELYQKLNSCHKIEKFYNKATKWYNKNQTQEGDDSISTKYNLLTNWFCDRLIGNSHLIGGPTFYFLRNEDKIRIIWHSDDRLKNGMQIWTASSGEIELNFNEFKSEIKRFGITFFKAMDIQIEKALTKDWGEINIDKKSLLEEHIERKKDFFFAFEKLNANNVIETNWSEILHSIKSNKIDV